MMAKKKPTKRTRPKPWGRTPTQRARHRAERKPWTWGTMNTFLGEQHWTVKGKMLRPMPRNTVAGCIYYAMRSVRKGRDGLVHARAVEMGLRSLTTQRGTFLVVQKELRLLARYGVIDREHSPKWIGKHRNVYHL